jgi:hypothetical protein
LQCGTWRDPHSKSNQPQSGAPGPARTAVCSSGVRRGAISTATTPPWVTLRRREAARHRWVQATAPRRPRQAPGGSDASAFPLAVSSRRRRESEGKSGGMLPSAPAFWVEPSRNRPLDGMMFARDARPTPAPHQASHPTRRNPRCGSRASRGGRAMGSGRGERLAWRGARPSGRMATARKERLRPRCRLEGRGAGAPGAHALGVTPRARTAHASEPCTQARICVSNQCQATRSLLDKLVNQSGMGSSCGTCHTHRRALHRCAARARWMRMRRAQDAWRGA